MNEHLLIMIGLGALNVGGFVSLFRMMKRIQDGTIYKNMILSCVEERLVDEINNTLSPDTRRGLAIARQRVREMMREK